MIYQLKTFTMDYRIFHRIIDENQLHRNIQTHLMTHRLRSVVFIYNHLIVDQKPLYYKEKDIFTHCENEPYFKNEPYFCISNLFSISC